MVVTLASRERAIRGRARARSSVLGPVPSATTTTGVLLGRLVPSNLRLRLLLHARLLLGVGGVLSGVLSGLLMERGGELRWGTRAPVVVLRVDQRLL